MVSVNPRLAPAARSVAEVVWGRLGHLSDAARGTAYAAAVCGPRAEPVVPLVLACRRPRVVSPWADPGPKIRRAGGVSPPID